MSIKKASHFFSALIQFEAFISQLETVFLNLFCFAAPLLSTQCAKGCGPHGCKYKCESTYIVFSQFKSYLNIIVLIFFYDWRIDTINF